MAEKKQELGALWAKKGTRGDYMTGTIKLGGLEERVVVFFNSNKKNEKEPDWRIYKSEPKPQRENTELNENDVPF